MGDDSESVTSWLTNDDSAESLVTWIIISLCHFTLLFDTFLSDLLTFFSSLKAAPWCCFSKPFFLLHQTIFLSQFIILSIQHIIKSGKIIKEITRLNKYNLVPVSFLRSCLLGPWGHLTRVNSRHGRDPREISHTTANALSALFLETLPSYFTSWNLDFSRNDTYKDHTLLLWCISAIRRKGIGNS